MTEPEQLDLAEAPAPIASAWEDARSERPGVPLARVINLNLDEQRFCALADGNAFPPDGSTVILPSVPGGRSQEEFDAIVADFDRRWHQAKQPAA